MGNSHSVSLLGNTGSPRFPCHLQLGGSAAIDFSKKVTEKDDDGEHTELWTVTYTVDGKTCEVRLEKIVEQDNTVNWVNFGFKDRVYIEGYNLCVSIQRRETGFQVFYWRCLCLETSISEKSNKTIDAWGRVTDTTIHLYGNENKGGLVIFQELKNNSRDEYLTTLTLAHYFVNRREIAFNAIEETDIGLSVVAKIRVSNGKFDITVEGPEQHPASALVFMFHEVNRTRVWRPTMCPHCSSNRRQFRRTLFSQSDSEDSDSVPLAPPPGNRQNARRIANGGRFRGNGNGNFIENLMVFGRRWW